MATYHLNTISGKVGKCSADPQKRGCLFSPKTPHFFSEAEAYEFFSKIAPTNSLQAKKRVICDELKERIEVLKHKLHEPRLKDTEKQNKLDVLLEEEIRAIGKVLLEEVDRKSSYSYEDFQETLKGLDEDSRRATAKEMVERIVNNQKNLIRSLRKTGGDLHIEGLTSLEAQSAYQVLEESVALDYPSDWIEASNSYVGRFSILPIGDGRASYGHRVLLDDKETSENHHLVVSEPEGFYYMSVSVDELEKAKELLGDQAYVVDAPAYLESDGFKRVIRMPLMDVEEQEEKPEGDGWRRGHFIDWRTDNVSVHKAWLKEVPHKEVAYGSKIRMPNQSVKEDGSWDSATERQKRTAYHEFAHRVEAVLGDQTITRMEQAFLNRRTQDENGNQRPLENIYPPKETDSFLSFERGRSGGFVEKYIGKEYVDSPAREVFSVGVESLLGGTYDSLSGASGQHTRDEDMRSFIFGLLATA